MAVKIYVASCVVLCCATIFCRAADVSKEHIPSICWESNGGVLFFRKLLGTRTVSAPKTKMLLPTFQSAAIVVTPTSRVLSYFITSLHKVYSYQ